MTYFSCMTKCALQKFEIPNKIPTVIWNNNFLQWLFCSKDDHQQIETMLLLFPCTNHFVSSQMHAWKANFYSMFWLLFINRDVKDGVHSQRGWVNNSKLVLAVTVFQCINSFLKLQFTYCDFYTVNITLMNFRKKYLEPQTRISAQPKCSTYSISPWLFSFKFTSSQSSPGSQSRTKTFDLSLSFQHFRTTCYWLVKIETFTNVLPQTHILLLISKTRFCRLQGLCMLETAILTSLEKNTVASLLDKVPVYRAGGSGSIPGRTNTQGLKIIEEKVLTLL